MILVFMITLSTLIRCGVVKASARRASLLSTRQLTMVEQTQMPALRLQLVLRSHPFTVSKKSSSRQERQIKVVVTGGLQNSNSAVNGLNALGVNPLNTGFGARSGDSQTVPPHTDDYTHNEYDTLNIPRLQTSPLPKETATAFSCNYVQFQSV